MESFSSFSRFIDAEIFGTDEQHLEAAQMQFLRQLFGITKLDKEKNQCIREKREHRT